jgi:hypothetical protein
VDSDDRHQQHHDHRQRGDGHKGAEQNEQAANNLNHDGGPAEQCGERHADRVQDRDKVVRSARQLGVAVLEEAQTDHEPERNRVPV